MKRPSRVCPDCGIIIYITHQFTYRCPTHGEFIDNFRTGELIKIDKPKKEVKK